MRGFLVISFIFSFVLFIFFIPTFSYSKVVRNLVTKSRIDGFTLKEMCKLMGYEHAVLVQIDSLSVGDCMGDKVLANDFCQKKFKNDPQLLRGYFSKDEKKVFCQRGSDVLVSVSCDGNDKMFCHDPKSGCLKLQKIYALKLSLYHKSVSGRIAGDGKGQKIGRSEKSEILNCHYSTIEHDHKLD